MFVVVFKRHFGCGSRSANVEAFNEEAVVNECKSAPSSSLEDIRIISISQSIKVTAFPPRRQSCPANIEIAPHQNTVELDAWLGNCPTPRVAQGRDQSIAMVADV